MELVTIAIPTLNRVEYLKLALQSALTQSYGNIEVIVSNNHSSDGTAATLAEIVDPRLKVVSQEVTLSMVDNWNACLAASSGSYFLLLSDDDLLETTAIAELVKVYESATPPERVGIVYCRGQYIDEQGRITRSGSPAPPVESAGSVIVAFLQSKRDTWPCSILYRRSDMAGGYDSSFRLGMDAAMWMQAVTRHGEAHFVNQSLVQYRVHQNATFSTPVSVWQHENIALADYAIAALSREKIATRQLVGKIQRAVKALNIKIIPGFIKNSSSGSKYKALGQYVGYLPRFASPVGIVVLMHGLLLLFLPASAVQALKRLRSMARGQGTA